MNKPKHAGFAERRETALAAKKQLIEKFASAPRPDDPAQLARAAERAALAAERDARRAEREQAKKAQAAALEEARRVEAEAQKQAELLAQQSAKAQSSEEALAEAAARKAERDRRYAARKQRQR